MRYLVLLDEGNIGWARVMKTRISFVGAQINLGNQNLSGGKQYKLKVQADNYTKSTFGNNVRFEIFDPINKYLLQLYCWFDGESIEIMAITDKNGAVMTDLPAPFSWIYNNQESTCQKLASIISKPFRYESKLYGLDAQEFFGPIKSSIKVRAAKIGVNPILVAKRIWPPYG